MQTDLSPSRPLSQSAKFLSLWEPEVPSPQNGIIRISSTTGKCFEKGTEARGVMMMTTMMDDDDNDDDDGDDADLHTLRPARLRDASYCEFVPSLGTQGGWLHEVAVMKNGK